MENQKPTKDPFNPIQDQLGKDTENKHPLDPEDLKVVVEKVKELKEDEFLGGNTTHLGLKNEKSFLIGTAHEELNW